MRDRRVERDDFAVERGARDAGEGVDVAGGELRGEEPEVCTPPLVARGSRGLLYGLRVEARERNGETQGGSQRDGHDASRVYGARIARTSRNFLLSESRSSPTRLSLRTRNCQVPCGNAHVSGPFGDVKRQVRTPISCSSPRTIFRASTVRLSAAFVRAIR